MRIQVLCVIAAVVLSGCMGGGDTPPLTETSSSSPGGGNPNTGAPCTEDCGPTGVRGRVVDREDLPVADVQVGLLETPFESLTTGAGEYEIENVPPGVYQIAFDRIGYDPEVRTVSVEDGEMTKVDVARVDEVVKFYEAFSPEKVESMFVSEYTTEEGQKQFESLWMFSRHLLMEAKQFLLQDNFDFAPNDMGGEHLVIEKQEYDFQEAGEDSRLTLTFTLRSDISAELKASGSNCDQLREICLRHFLPNLVPGA